MTTDDLDLGPTAGGVMRAAGEAGAQAAVRPATTADVPAVAVIFGRAFEDYRRGLGVGAAALSRLWRASLAARVNSTMVAVSPDGRVVGFVVVVKPRAKEQYGGRGEDWREAGRWWRDLGASALWRLPVLFIPMGLAYARRHAQPDEAYISLVGVDPAVQGRGIGQALLAAVEAEARAAGASAILLHTASTNTRARAAYARAGYELVCTVRAPWQGPVRIPAYLALRKPLRPDPTPLLDALA